MCQSVQSALVRLRDDLMSVGSLVGEVSMPCSPTELRQSCDGAKIKDLSRGSDLCRDL